MLSFQEVYNIATSLPPKDLQIQELSIYDAHHKILAQDVYAVRALPPFDHSAMDGFGFNFKDFEKNKELKVGGSILAGEDAAKLAYTSEALRIMTGAMIPEFIDTIIPFEQAKFNPASGKLSFLKTLQKGSHIRKKGEEIKPHSLILPAGKRLSFGDLGLLASQGLARILVQEPLKIGVFSSGDELAAAGTQASAHQIFDCNTPAIYNALLSQGFKPGYLGRLRDDSSMLERISRAAGEHHVLITSGGASSGDADLFCQALQTLGAKILSYKVNVKPGKPLLIAELGGCSLFCLPGNPASALLNLLAIVIPSLHALSKAAHFHPIAQKCFLKEALHFQAARTHLILGILEGQNFLPFPIQPNAISPLSRCNAFAIFHEGIHQAEKHQSMLAIRLEYELCGEACFINF